VFKYVHTLDVDEALAKEDASSGASTSYHADALGSIAKLTDAAGAAVRSYQYDPWGSLQVGSGESGFAFTGREWDPETALYYYRARYYNATAGRFLSEDPGRWLVGLHFYVYASASPATYGDPSGLVIDPRTRRRRKVGDPVVHCQAYPGASACTYPDLPPKIYPTPCERRSFGPFGFDVSFTVVVTTDYESADTPGKTSSDTPPDTVETHENRHARDFQDALDPRTINKAIATEGFSCPEDCERARGRFGRDLLDYLSKVAKRSHEKLDPLK
jgi:RHS repeat-associated protein